ncbi:MAG: hypothetical protein ACE366_26135 [Bradymonadia bacterium]
MGTITHWLRSAVEAALGALDGLSPWVSLAIVSVVSGLIMALAMAKLGRPEAMTRARDQMAAAVYEIRLFLDAPRRVVSAQGRLIFWNLRYLATWMPALVVLTPPLGLLWLHLDARHGYETLPLERPVVITATLDDGVDPLKVQAEASDGVEITAPVVRVPAAADRPPQVKIRAKLTAQGRHEVTLTAPGAEPATKSLVGPEGGAPRPTRSAGLAQWWTLGDEAPLPQGWVSIDVPHPDAASWVALGLSMPWWGWWLILATLVVLALKRPLKLSF